MSNIPGSYIPAKWRNSLPVDADGFVGIGFDVGDGDIIRLRLSTHCARQLSESLNNYLSQSQSTIDPGIPKKSVS